MLLKYLSKIKDGRRAQSRQYRLDHLLLLSIWAIMSGASSYRDIATFIKITFKDVKQILKIKWKKPPSYSTIRRAIIQADSKTLEKQFRKFSNYINKKLSQEFNINDNVIAIDGKVLRNSGIDKQNPLLMLYAYSLDTDIILGHQFSRTDKSGEIKLLQILVKNLELPEKTIIMADALHTQKKHKRPSKRKVTSK